MKVRLLIVSVACLFGSPTIGQDALTQATDYIQRTAPDWNILPADIKDLTISDRYRTKHNGVEHIFFQQQYQGIPIYQAIVGVHINSAGEVVYATHRLESALTERINTTQPRLNATDAIRRAASHLGYAPPTLQPLPGSRNRGDAMTFEGGELADRPIQARLIYASSNDGQLRLAWQTDIDERETADYWSILIDASNGAILQQNNYTIHCNFGGQSHTHRLEGNQQPRTQTMLRSNTLVNSTTGTYNVFPIPVESPIHGDRALVVDPADPEASPFGWHDTNGQPGPEFTITRGNNTHAYIDTAATNAPNRDEPDGGINLVFDFPFYPEEEPDTNQDAVVTQLFYMNNIMHDFTWHYGFDEAAGNFQARNYTGEGRGADAVFAEAQDGSGTNNANFATPPDGAGGRMQMFLWSTGGNGLLQVDEPAFVAGRYQTGTADFGPLIDIDPITGQLVEGFDDSNNPSFGCEPIVNAAEVAGKVVLLDRGGCFFEQKVINAEAAGAIAVIIANFENNTINMAGVAEIPNPDIPTIMIRSADADALRQALDLGEVIVTLQREEGSGPAFIDSGFDNGVIAHEYGHGVSNRLTGGPSIASCLFNDEQMGEGWSDFFTLITTVEEGDFGEMPRGVGSYSDSRNPEGGTIRRLPYSTDFSINDQTFDDIIGTTAPHPLGEIWAGVLWDLYWALVKEYGFDPNPYDGTGGNNIAIQLVMDGMKLQACNPGFIDGRDAIIAADLINNNGANECLIWEVFARRGLGWEASQGLADDRNDGFQDFSTRPECIQELKIDKQVTELIEPGDTIQVELTIVNHKEEVVTAVQVQDILPEGLTLLPGSATGSSNIETQEQSILYRIDRLEAGDERRLRYKAVASPELKSNRFFFDDLEDGDLNWLPFNLTGLDIWELSEESPFSGDFSWFVPNTTSENDQTVQLFEPLLVEGAQPVLRFYHQYDTEAGTDAGLIEISNDGGTSWNIVPDALILRNSYRGQVAYGTFSLPNLAGYWGESDGYIDTYIDLSSYRGEDILFRFRFGSDAEAENATTDETGWFVDDIEIMDLLHYNSEACVRSAEGDQACAMAPDLGTVVQPFGTVTSVAEAEEDQMALYPNPANDRVQLGLPQDGADWVIELVNASGQVVLQTRSNGNAYLQLDVSNLPGGFYFVRLQAGTEVITHKLVVQ